MNETIGKRFPDPSPTEPTGLELALSVLEQQRELLSEARAAIEAAAANTEYIISILKGETS